MPPVHDYVIDNSTGANVRADINNALAAIVSNNSSSSQPTTRYAYMWWADTTNGVLKIRNSANDGWVELLQLDGTLTLEDGSASTPGLAFRDDLNTGIYSSAADTFNIATGGVERLNLGTVTIFNQDGADVDFRIEGDTEANLFYLDAGNDRIGVRTASPDRHFTINASTTTRMNIKSGSGSTAGIEFGDSDDFNAGFIVYDNSDNSLAFGVNGSGEKVRIASNGGLCVNSTSADNNVHIGITSSSTGIILKAAGDHHSLIDANSNRSSAGNTLHRFLGRWNGTQVALMAFVTGSDTTNKDDGHITFSTSSADNLSEKARLLSTGKFVIGGTTDVAGGSPLQVLDTTDAGAFFGNSQTNASGNIDIQFAPSNNVTTSFIRGYAIEDASSAAAMTGGLKFFIREDANFKEAIRIDREGNLNMAEAIDGTIAKLNVEHSGNNGTAGVPTYISRFVQATNNTGSDHACILLQHAAASSGQDGVGMQFRNSGATEVGKIDIGQSTTNYRTSSDYRLKENAVDISDGISRLKTLKPYRFNFIAEPDRTVDGFFAHEVTAVPEAISGTKDEVETTYYRNGDDIPEGKVVGDVKSTTSPVYQGIDHSKLVPLLVAAVKELITKVETLEAA